ncbi:MAG: RIP metalloprotease RseP [Gammaproteobacteria bacterium]|nr:MAG: RIP metalloprotease RseP [Gammaproteobacteria bacterium]
MSLLYTIAVTLVTLGILVTIHEWGHFIVARRAGVKVLRFSIGFGHPLFGWKDRHGTEFVVAWIPLGGYVKMLDEREAPVAPEEHSVSFNAKPVSRRMAIAAAGPLANLVLAFAVLWVVYLGGVSGLAPIIDRVEPGSLAAQAGLDAGQEIISVDGELTPTWRQLNWQLLRRIGDSGEMQVSVRYPGSSLIYQSVVHLDGWMSGSEAPDPQAALGIALQVPALPAIVDSVQAGSPAEVAGFLPGDEIVMAEGQPVKDWVDWVTRVRERPGQAVTVWVNREGQSVSLTVTPALHTDEAGQTFGQVGMGVRTEWPKEMVRHYRYSPLEAIPAAASDCWRYVTITLDSLRKMLVGLISPRHLSGPVTIAKVAGSSAKAGWQAYLEVLALLSVSLAVINLLPIPVLDGGHLLLYAIEGLMGRPVPEKVQQIAFQIGFSIIIGITILALFNDFSRL